MSIFTTLAASAQVDDVELPALQVNVSVGLLTLATVMAVIAFMALALVVPSLGGEFGGAKKDKKASDTDLTRGTYRKAALQLFGTLALVVLMGFASASIITSQANAQDRHKDQAVALVKNWAQSRGLSMSDRDAKAVVEQAQRKHPKAVKVYFEIGGGDITKRAVAYDKNDNLLLGEELAHIDVEDQFAYAPKR